MFTKSDASCDSNNPAFQQEFIARNGQIGIYEPNLQRAFIGDDSYKGVKVVLNSGRRARKPRGLVELGKLIDGENIKILYGKDSDPLPVNEAPDADVLTEQEIGADFGRDFGSGGYTPGDKWD